jgi:hypothetical protein
MSPKDEFDLNGLVILRGLLEDSIGECVEEWDYISEMGRTVQWNPVAVDVSPESACRELSQVSRLRNVVADCLGATDRVYNVRFVVKDKHAKDAVFLHQDAGYHIGSLPKLSAFVALSSVIPENGGLRFWLGTHKYGYLGDVGEINPACVKTKHHVVCPALAPGDAVLMHSALWHDSGPNVCGVDRVLIDIIYQRADDPAKDLPREGLFLRSRSSRLKELQAEVDAKK